ncbi:MAG: polysaccharide biosynthesis tyrosine autokinase [Deltaproteobacteria bacterium]|nr:polysaccharide biosynthesis tyrosine autokinase [Deltaproteobacteria bacterium]
MKNNNDDLSPAIRPLPRYLPEKVSENPYAYSAGRLDAHGEHSLHHFLEVIIKRRKVVIAVAGAVIALVAAYSFWATRLYTATTSIKIGTYSPALPGDGSEDVLRAKTLEQDYLNTQVDQLTSLSVADKVLSDPENGEEILAFLRRTNGAVAKSKIEVRNVGVNENEDAYHYPQKVLKAYLGLIHVEPVFKTSLARVSATTSEPMLSAKIANAHARAFIDYARAERRKMTIVNLLFLSNQARELEDKVSTAESNIGKYSEQNSLITLDSNENLVIKQISELNQKLSDASALRVRTEAALNESKTGSGLKSSSLDDDTIRNLRTELNAAQAEYAMLSSKFGDAYPRMSQLKARLDELKKALKMERQGSIDALEARYKSALAAEEELKSQLESLKTEAFDVSRKQVQLHIMRREFESLKDLHQSVLRRLKEVQLTAENPSSNIIVTELAAVPDFPSSPRRTLNLLMALGFGPLLGFLAAFALETLDNSLGHPDEVRNVLGLPTLGVIPVFSDRPVGGPLKGVKLLGMSGSKSDASRPAKGQPERATYSPPAVTPAAQGTPVASQNFVTISAPRSIAAEAFQTIRTGLLLSSPEQPPQLVLVTSATKSEGKTTLISNLAITMAQAGSRVVLVDCDLRRPSVYERFSISREAPGVVDFLTGQKRLSDVLVATSVPNLSIIPAGALSPNPAALIGSKKMGELLRKLSEMYEFVLLDAPPILPVSDALMLSRMGAGVILVVHGKETRKRHIQEATRRLQEANAGILGVVVNHSDTRDEHYYAYDPHIVPGETIEVSEQRSANGYDA